jgi:hypothetical protein
MREDALIQSHQDVILRHPDHRTAAVMVALGLALVNESMDRWAEARHWYVEAQRRCPAARVKPNQRIAQMIVEGLDRLPPETR